MIKYIHFCDIHLSDIHFLLIRLDEQYIITYYIAFTHSKQKQYKETTQLYYITNDIT